MRSDKRMVNLCILLLPFILAVLMFVASLRLVHKHLNVEKNLENADYVMHYVHKNLNAAPILSWKRTSDTTTNSCAVDYSQATLGNWEGISGGCMCGSGK